MDQAQILLVHVFASPLGKVKWKAVPPFVPGSNHMRPPCASTIVLQIDRPMPIPLCFEVTNGWKSWGEMDSLIPEPVSSTVT
jgi:hypothetical protein